MAARHMQWRDSLPPNVIRVARTCIGRFSSRDATAENLADLFSVALAAGEDTLAAAALTHVLATISVDSQRTQVLHTGLVGYLDANPARIDAAQALVARTLGTSTAGPVAGRAGHSDGATQGVELWLDLHTALLHFLAAEHFDSPACTQMIDSILRFVLNGRGVRAGVGPRQTIVLRMYYNRLRQVLIANADAPSAVADSAWFRVARQEKNDLVRITPDTQWYEPGPKGALGPAVRSAGLSPEVMQSMGYRMVVYGSDWREAPLSLLVRYFTKATRAIVDDTARRSHSLDGAQWFPVDADTAANRPGTVTLRYHLEENCLVDYEAPLMGDVCTTPLSQLQRWQQEYGSKLRITVVTTRHGHALYSGPQSLADEVQTIAWYVREHWRIPAAIAVVPPSQLMKQTENTGDPFLPRDELEVINDMGRVLYRGPLVADAPIPDNIGFLTALLAHLLPASNSPGASAASLPVASPAHPSVEAHAP